MLTPGTVVNGRYRIERHMESARGERYEAYDEIGRQPVTIQAWIVTDSAASERVRHAARSWSVSGHPVLPAIIDHFSQGERYLLVTEHLNGQSLADRLQVQGRPYAPAQVLQWADPLLDAIVSLHRQSPTLPHGDISADNLIETSEGELKLSGVDLYAIGGTNAPTEAEDVYDLAATLYHLLTGVKPPSMAGRAERGFLPAADSLNPAVPQALSTVLAQALSENPDDRFRSAYALQNALRKASSTLSDAVTTVAPRAASTLADKLRQRHEAPPDVPAIPDPIPAAPEPFTFEPQPIAAGAQSTAPAEPLPQVDPHRISFGEPAGQAAANQEPPRMPPPAYETPQAAPPANKNRIWLAVGLGCLGALLCVCCGLLGLIAYQWESIAAELESSGIPVGEPVTDSERPTESETSSDGEGPLDTDGVTVSVFELSIGDCFNDPSSEDLVQELTLVDCDTPHDNEVFAFGSYPGEEGDAFPSEGDLDDFSETFCSEEFESYVGLPYSDSIYYIYYLQPTEASWADGDREVVCILYDRDGQIEGSKEGTAE